MINYLCNKPGWRLLIGLVSVSILFNYFSSSMLEKSYEASQFPVPYFEAQLSFSAEKLVGWYEFLVQNDTMDIYISTQHIDYIFMLSVLMLHLSTLLLISRAFKTHTMLRKYMVYAALLSTLAPMFDALENGVSYIMLANHSSFPTWLALVYSSFAAAKFVMFMFAYIAAPTGIIAFIVTLPAQKKRQGSAVHST